MEKFEDRPILERVTDTSTSLPIVVLVGKGHLKGLIKALEAQAAICKNKEFTTLKSSKISQPSDLVSKKISLAGNRISR